MGGSAARLGCSQRARRLAARSVAQVRALGVGVGVRAYKPEPWSAARWEHAYGQGEFDYMADLGELPRYSQLIGYLRTHPGRPAVLDIGCGSGRLRELLAEEDFASYVGLDISHEAIATASRLRDARTEFMVGDVTTMTIAPADVVVLNEMLYYSPAPRELLRRIATIVRPGGLVLSSIWRHPGDRALWRLIDRELEPVAAARVRAEGNPYNRRGWRVSCHRVKDR
ncbi:MAG TPA: class I SAM-dependent methyltransferase [Solirubrobacteraceae bacterium]|nr:class I SAM-dependent methyltransferase [Solirubrobacteraceae bacterium]